MDSEVKTRLSDIQLAAEHIIEITLDSRSKNSKATG